MPVGEAFTTSAGIAHWLVVGASTAPLATSGLT
jgi:hypothetical protein